MYLRQDALTFSAGDLSNYLGCRHLSQLDRAVAHGRLDAPTRRDPGLVLLQERGLAHEAAYVEALRRRGVELVDLRDVEEGATALERTRHAMQRGVDGIVQGALQHGHWMGRADILRRVETTSDLGPWSYEVVDTKLAQQTRGGTLLQLALYSDLLQPILGRHPEHMHVVKPGADFPTETYRWHDFAAYFRHLKEDFERTLVGSEQATEPLPVPQCDVCRWWSRCDTQRRAEDHLCLVAGLQQLHMVELRRQGLDTLKAFAEHTAPLDKPRQGSLDTYLRLQQQAQVQLAGRQDGPTFRFRPPPAPPASPLEEPPAWGLGRLPQPSPGDIFFDFEGDPFIGDGGLEYLFGYASRMEDGSFTYRALWALDRQQEKQAFEDFIDDVMERLDEDPNLHIYHFSPYEPGAVKRLMGRHGSREAEVDRLLRGERFVDLLAVTRQSMWASVERYSLKELEPFYAFRRDLDLRDASQALQRLSWALELGRAETLLDDDRRRVELYNREDCLSTAALQAWLEERRDERLDAGLAVPRPPRPDDGASETLQEQQAEVREVFDALTDGLPSTDTAFEAHHQGRRLLAHLLDYFRREDKSSWWEYFRLRDLDAEQLADERKAIAGLRFIEEVAATSGRLPVHRYAFDEQETAVRVGHTVCAPGGVEVGKVYAVDGARRTVDLRKKGTTVEVHPRAIFSKEIVRPRPLDTSLLHLGRTVAELLATGQGIDGDGPYRAARDLLLRHKPRRTHATSGLLRRDGESVLDAARRVAAELDHGVLAIQGPPGTGKTYLGARLIVDLVRRGRRVGVTAVSHKVIRNLLEETLRAADEAGTALEVAHKAGSKKPGEGAAEPPDGYSEVKDNGRALAALDDKVVGGTAWLWAGEGADQTLDVLIVDEAGQMSLAHVLAAARSARNLVLLGDPQQLEQPQRGSHPEGADAAALEHLLGDATTLPPDCGLFLDTTWRLSPEICAFTSELFYDNRLHSEPSLVNQALLAPPPWHGNGLYYLPVAHQGNQASAPQEVDAVVDVVQQLLDGDTQWVDADGSRHPLTPQDILVVAPFNAHVDALAGRLPQLRVGTVDRFQGQQAPVVIYALASSTAEEAPRGMQFLLDPHRLNVATSRARCLVLLVASPRLFEASCRTPQQMTWVNGLCRFRELATEVG